MVSRIGKAVALDGPGVVVDPPLLEQMLKEEERPAYLYYRLGREDNPAELMQRAERLGLYKPQSGTYGAKLGEQGDIFGKSELEKIRAAA